MKMAEEKTKTTLEKIESLILDGNKEVIDRMVKLEEGQKDLADGQKKLEDGQREILEKVKEAHKSLKNEIVVTALAVKETVKEEIKRVEDKLDASRREVGIPQHIKLNDKEAGHMRQPVHA